MLPGTKSGEESLRNKETLRKPGGRIGPQDEAAWEGGSVDARSREQPRMMRRYGQSAAAGSFAPRARGRKKISPFRGLE